MTISSWPAGASRPLSGRRRCSRRFERGNELMRAYYNEIDKYCAGWLRNLVSASLIPDGDVDERPIEQVSPNDLKTYTQCHFFAGIAGWPLALRLARWGDTPVWTG